MPQGRGYIGFSMSRNAAYAYEDLCMPKTAFKKHYKISEKKFRELLDADILDEEWHHTSKFYNKTNFYKATEEALCEMDTKQADIELSNLVDEFIEYCEPSPDKVVFPFEVKADCTRWSHIVYKNEIRAKKGWAKRLATELEERI
jgi:hypothetical protein